MATAAERQAAYRKRKNEQGLVQINAWVHPHQVADVTLLLQRLRNASYLTAGPVRDTFTGKLRKLHQTFY